MFGHDSSAIPYVLTALDIGVSLVASAHVLLFKSDTRAAIGWIGLIWLSPMLGVVLYVLLGINRINRRARSLRRGQAHPEAPRETPCPPEVLDRALGPEGPHLGALVHLVDHVAPWPLLAGNDVELLVDGDQAYPAMVRAIDEATRSITLCTYIFDIDRAGNVFVDALARAVDRGIEVRVLIDDLGARHSWPSLIRSLRRARVPFARFLPTFAPGWFPYLNLRNHRKILVADGRVGFTGGLNILEDYLLGVRPRHPKHDLHFRVLGPAVAHLQQVFADDWALCNGELLEGDAWFPPLAGAGAVLARGVVDGPDDDRDNLIKVILGALACAVDRGDRNALLPARCQADLGPGSRRLARRAGRYPAAEPEQSFPGPVGLHGPAPRGRGGRMSRLVLATALRPLEADDRGSGLDVHRLGQLEPRSFRLNFELNLECYGRELAARLDPLFRDKLRDAIPVTTRLLDSRSLPIKLRDGIARLLSPYL